MTQSPSLAGALALVTGASSGLGRHFAHTLARAGATVALAARRTEQLQTVAAEIQREGGQALALRMDVTDATSVRAAFDELEAARGAATIIVNNSGIAVSKPVLDQDESDWDAVLDTNLKGAFLVATEAARRLRAQQRGGSIINIASILGFRQAGALSPYAASKAGLVQLTRNMALELARYNIRVNAIAPGYFETDINRDFWSTKAGLEMIARIPQRRLGQFEDLDAPLLLLAGDGSRYMTGSVLTVDGGHLTSSL